MQPFFPRTNLGRAIAPPGFRPKFQHEIDNFIVNSIKADSKGLSRPRQAIYGSASSFQPTAKQKLIALIKKRNKKSGKTYWSRGEVLR